MYIALNLGTRAVEQRPHDAAAARCHAAEPAQTGAAQQVEKKCLGLVLAVMGHGDGCRPLAVGQLLKPRIAQLAARHLERLAGRGAAGIDVEVAHTEVYPEAPGQRLDVAHVAV